MVNKIPHKYELANAKDTNAFQVLQFLHMEKVDGSYNLIKDGTTNEEVLKALINRLDYQNYLLYNEQTATMLVLLEEALSLQESLNKEKLPVGNEPDLKQQKDGTEKNS